MFGEDLAPWDIHDNMLSCLSNRDISVSTVVITAKKRFRLSNGFRKGECKVYTMKHLLRISRNENHKMLVITDKDPIRECYAM